MNKKDFILTHLKEFGIIFLSSAIYAVGFNWFFLPNNISMGGFTGIAQIINLVLPFMPIGVTMILLNVPLFYIGFKKLGWRLLINSLVAMAIGPILIDGLGAIVTFPPMDPLLACLYGGVVMGLSAGLMLKVGGTTGGSELAGRLLKFKFPHLPIGKLCLMVDLTVVVLYALVFRNFDAALYSIAAMYVMSITVDAVIYGSQGAKIAYIISDVNEKVTACLLKMNLGVTLLNGQGAFTNEDKRIVLCAFKRNQIAAIKAAVTAIDPNAFIIVCDAHEVLGEGFGTYTPDEL